MMLLMVLTAWAEVRTQNGRTLRSQTDFPKGDPENALSWDEMKQKFTHLSSPVITGQRQTEIISKIESLESMTDMRDLAALLAIG